ncbi:Protein-disulfide isomerase [Candidatus Pantoea symbiotica]|jgi:protein-disulfide isomerase|uniref:Protein-disulfide isomerase n=1 Tax=Candidatus Pantoea symbiotica TaxID=1884370 RepID=A0A1I3YLG3_9GAMM|nr:MULTISPECIES: thioredoxin domain-containing protein [Pantoea]SFK32664.1 Protein-disulfide isomerase [Pantoea symbiotica]SFU86283.1 Protein-disulfide isomerase [Pantoea sp. YR525]
MLKALIVPMILLPALPAPAQIVSIAPGHIHRVPAPELVAYTPERVPETEALIRSNLLDDPHSPRVGALQPALTLVCFTDYSCKACKGLDEKLHRLLALHPQLAVTYKFSPSMFQPLNPSRMALTLWEQQPSTFEAFHRYLMRYQGLLDDYSIRNAVRSAGSTIYQLSPDVTHTLALNKALMKKLNITHTPATLIGDTVLTGDVPFSELEEAVKRAQTET